MNAIPQNSSNSNPTLILITFLLLIFCFVLFYLVLKRNKQRKAKLPLSIPDETEPPLTPSTDELIKDFQYILSPYCMADNNKLNEISKKILEIGEGGINLLLRCMNEIFSIRARMGLFLGVFNIVTRKTKDIRLLSILERILDEGSNQVKGYPTPPDWMPTLKPVIIGGGQYGWDDPTWIQISHSITQLLFEIIPQLPSNAKIEHLNNLSNSVNYCIERSNNVINNTDSQAVKMSWKEELTFWESVKLKINNIT